MRSFCIAKAFLIFSTKNICVLGYKVIKHLTSWPTSSTKNISMFGYKVVKHLTSWPLNELVKLRMLWTTGPWLSFISGSLKPYKFSGNNSIWLKYGWLGRYLAKTGYYNLVLSCKGHHYFPGYVWREIKSPAPPWHYREGKVTILKHCHPQHFLGPRVAGVADDWYISQSLGCKNRVSCFTENAGKF